MKHPFLILALGLFMSLCACTSEEDKAQQTVQNFVEAVQKNDKELQKEIFPSSTMGSCAGISFDLKGAQTTKVGKHFVVMLPGSRTFFVEKNGDNYIITDSRNVLATHIDTNYDRSMDGMIRKAISSRYSSESKKYGIA